MKRSLAGLMFIFVLGIGSTALSEGTAAPVTGSQPTLREVRYRLHDQTLKVREGIKSGKYTRSQVKSLNSVLRKVRSRLNADIKQNGNKALTPDQEKELNLMLDGTSMTLYGDIR